MPLFFLTISGEVATKSPPVRRRMIRLLRRNLSSAFPEARLSGGWDHLFLESENDLLEPLADVPGIAKIFRIRRFPFVDLPDLFTKISPIFADEIAGRTFCVRVKRVGHHPFRSPDAERFLGAEFLKFCKSASVKMKNPDCEIALEIRGKEFFVRDATKVGMSGFPTGSTGHAAVLISGGFDSSVAAYLMMRKGLSTDFVFCNLGGETHENGVRAVTKFLAERFSRGALGDFFSLDFRPIVAEILTKITPRFRGIVLKRMMLRAAERSVRKDAALVTGESLAQVSSQTLENLAVIEKAISKPLFRPLLGFDKNEIIAQSQKIGAASFAEKMPEFCAVVSEKPATAARMRSIEIEEKHFDSGLLENIRVEKIPIAKLSVNEIRVPVRHFLLENEVVIDLRESEEIAEIPLDISPKQEIPFAEIGKKFSELDPTKSYFFFCERGVLSRSVAEDLQKRGFDRVGIFLPLDEKHLKKCSKIAQE